MICCLINLINALKEGVRSPHRGKCFFSNSTGTHTARKSPGGQCTITREIVTRCLPFKEGKRHLVVIELTFRSWLKAEWLPYTLFFNSFNQCYIELQTITMMGRFMHAYSHWVFFQQMLSVKTGIAESKDSAIPSH